jgi:hypothetical protein
VRQRLEAGEPAISVDTKKKELMGEFKNAGKELRPKGDPEDVRGHDFVDPEQGRAVPYGVYDLKKNVSVARNPSGERCPSHSCFAI